MKPGHLSVRSMIQRLYQFALLLTLVFTGALVDGAAQPGKE